ncbi:MAG: DinB family protein, partial [Candidatus Eisenbacteria bacterium]|nr:DinB family protein [Candidatus Eisenbacteria bacterium]
LNKSLAMLERTPRILQGWLPGLPEEWIRQNEGPDTWSAFDIVGHLVHGEKTDWISRMKRILEHGTTVPFDPFDRFAQFRDSEGKSMEDLLEEFRGLRGANLTTLRAMGLDQDALGRRGTHPALGTVTLRELLATWTVHDLGHLAQISRVLAKHYGSDVGPWHEYLPILTRG